MFNGIPGFGHFLARRRVSALLATVAALLVLLALAIHFTPRPQIESSFGGATVSLAADRAWTLLPGQCSTVRWTLEGIQSIYINGEGNVGSGELEFCPKPNDMTVAFEITAADGETRNLTFIIQGLPAAIEAWLLFLALLLPLLIAGYYLATMRLGGPPIAHPSLLLLLVALLPLGLLLQTAQPTFIASVLDRLGQVFRSHAWQALGALLAGLIYAPLALQALRQCRARGKTGDLAAAAAFFVVALLLYAPAGFDSIGQWETWTTQSFFEGRPAKAEHEVIARFWIFVPHALAMAISPDAFAGYHLVNLCLFWCMMAAFYAVLRQLRAPAWLAFLVTILFLVYPVNSRLMSIRSIAMTFGKVSLLAAIALILDCRKNPSRLKLLGVWLALLFNVGSYEIALVIILVAPLLWWWQAPRSRWRNINLTVVWYLAPVAKAAHLLLLLMDGRFFYGVWFISGPSASDHITLDKLGNYVERVASVYRRAFVDGWGEALQSISQNSQVALTAATLALVGGVAAYQALNCEREWRFPPHKRVLGATLAGLLFILPSIGVLMWLSKQAGDLWRMYVYVPIGAAIAAAALIVLVSAPIKRIRQRLALVIGLSLLLTWPGLSRLYLQQAAIQQNANAKAGVLRQIVEQAPSFHENAHLMLFTTMSGEDLEQEGVRELRYNMFESAMYMLYQERRPVVSFLCIAGQGCSRDDTFLQYTSRDFLGADEDYRDVVMFQLHDDLRVELLRELPLELRERPVNRYDPERLIDFSAPVPPRARTLLGAAWRD
ncbi:MAG: hypothetical protein F4X02_18130 [Chloroflexi bacterium]|nr:hypothetical protein [Chloroflexota bacterium]